MNSTATASRAPTEPKDKLLTKKRAADRLSISTRTLDRMVTKRLIEKVFVGQSVRFRESDIDAIIARGV